MSFRVAICDRDGEFALSLTEYFNRCEDMPIKATMFTMGVSLEEGLRHSRYDLILLGECSYMPDTDMNVVYMCEEKERCYSQEYIYKYQNVTKIGSQIYSYIKKQKLDREGPTVTYGIFSPIGRCGKTAIAEGLCGLLGDSLYIGFEEYPSHKLANPSDREASDRFLYYLSQQHSGVLEFLGERVRDDRGVVYLRDFSSCMDIRQLELEHISWFVGLLKDSEIFKTVVFDLCSSALSDYSILNAFDKIISPLPEDEISTNKVFNFRQCLCGLGLHQLDTRIRYVSPPVWDGEESLREYFDREDII